MNYRLWAAAMALSLLLPACQPYRLLPVEPELIRAVTKDYVEFESGRRQPMPFAGQEKGQWIFLVRHSEKGYGYDPGLTRAGKRRSAMLAEILSPGKLAAVYASEFRRAQETAAPVASQQGLETGKYETDELTAFYRMLRRKYRGQAVLVAGHSNTTPILVNKIVGEQLLDDIPETDYNNFFVVAISEKGEKEILQLKFGFSK